MIFVKKQNKINEWPDFFSLVFLCFFNGIPRVIGTAYASEREIVLKKN
jgi:hypothetical protein